MKVAILTNEYPPNVYGGAGVHVDYLTKVLSKLMKVHVSYFGNKDRKSKNLTIKGYETALRVSSRYDRKAGKALDALSINLHTINEFPRDVDLVHTHTWYTAFSGIVARILYGIPHVLTTHSLEPLRAWKREQLGRGYDLSSWIEKTAIETASGIIAVSKETKKDILKHFNVSPHKIKVIYNGIDIKEYSPRKSKTALRKYGLKTDKPYVLFVGRITRQKGIIHLVNAIKHINKEVQVVLCAGAPDTKEIALEMKSAVKSAMKDHPAVIWIDKMVPRRDVIELYTHASVFCCPSVYEPFGIINLEAMACGTPVVATKTGGIIEVIEHGKSGFLVPISKKGRGNHEPKDPAKFSKSLASSVNRIVCDAALSRKMGSYGRKVASERFSWESIGRQTKDYYEFLVGFMNKGLR